MRQSSSSSPAFNEAQSPLKCLNNLTDPSPTKKLPTILKNPFNQLGVKRKLNLQSPNKRTKMFEIDEDANLEPPKMKMTTLDTSLRSSLNKTNSENSTSKNLFSKKPCCYENNWMLRTSMKVTFNNNSQCKNWNDLSTSTHKRSKNSPSKLYDKTISVDAIKNLATYYQYPYLPWQPLYPRQLSAFLTETKTSKSFDPSIPKVPELVFESIMRDWYESFDDLTNLLIDGKCPYFYVCSDNSTFLFKATPSSNPKRPLVQAYISPINLSFGMKLNESKIEYKLLNSSSKANTSINSGSRDDFSQSSFASRSNISILDKTDSKSTQSPPMLKQDKTMTTVDSGNGSDEEDENEEDTESILADWALDRTSMPMVGSQKKSFLVENDTNTQTKVTKAQPLAVVEGLSNIRKLSKFLRNKPNQAHIKQNVGAFAKIPSTLLSPCEFRFCTPQYPEVILSKNMIETGKVGPTKNSDKNESSESARQQKPGANLMMTPKKNNLKQSRCTDTPLGPTYFQLKGAILPSVYPEIHKLLSISDNMNHSCQSTKLDITGPFEGIEFSNQF